MQQINVKEIKGPLGKGERKFYAVVDEKGAEFTTFDTKIAQVTPGSVLEIEIEVKGKFVNISEWKLISEGATSVVPTPSGGGWRGKDIETLKLEEAGRRYRQNIDRVSIERQTAYNGAISLLTHQAERTLLPETATEVNALILEALRWGRQAIKTVTADVTTPGQVKTEADPEWEKMVREVKQTGGFKNLGEFLMKCKEVFNANRTDVLLMLGISDFPADADLNKLYLKVSEHMAKRKEKLTK